MQRLFQYHRLHLAWINGDNVHFDIDLPQARLHQHRCRPLLRDVHRVELVEFRNPGEVAKIISGLYTALKAKAGRSKNSVDVVERLSVCSENEPKIGSFVAGSSGPCPDKNTSGPRAATWGKGPRPVGAQVPQLSA